MEIATELRLVKENMLKNNDMWKAVDFTTAFCL